MTGKSSGYKNQPTHWPTAPFVVIKLFQALCCLVVLLIMAFFGYNLKKDNYPIPWQFAFLLVIGALTFLTVFGMAISFCCRSLNPLFTLITESILSILWAMGAGVLGKGMGGNTIRSCSIWRTQAGMAVCHLFKTTFAFCILSWFAMICGILLASSVRRKATFHKYQPAPNPKQATSYTPQSTTGQTSLPYGQGGTYKAQDSSATHT